MIVFPDGKVALAIALSLEKRVVDSVSGNPRAMVTLEFFDDIPTQINTNTGTSEVFEVSSCGDMTMFPKGFRDIEDYLISRHPRFIGCRGVQ